jgi:phosphoribosylamine--glycine ligase
MPPGIPVATMGIGKAGARNGGVLALRILALTNPELGKKLVKFKQDMVIEVEEKVKKLNVR